MRESEWEVVKQTNKKDHLVFSFPLPPSAVQEKGK